MADEERDEQEKKSQDEFAFPSDDFRSESEESKPDSEEEGLGSLPPLSEFESESSGEDEDYDGGLPPLSDIEVQTPAPTGGNIKPPPSGFSAESGFDTPTEGGIETPPPQQGGQRPAQQQSGTGFQDLAADSDFSPETPEIGPGPESDSDMETPMFDSAFGGGESDFESPTPTPDTESPTMAMETPMFGQQGGGQTGQTGQTGGRGGFDEDAFGSGGGFGGGTPVPDFSPDTGATGSPPPQTPPPTPAMQGGGDEGGGRGGGLLAVVMLLVGILVGIVAAPYLSGYLSFLPNPTQAELEDARSQISTLETRLARYEREAPGGDVGVSQEMLDEMLEQKSQLTSEIEQLEDEHEQAMSEAEEARAQLEEVQQNLDQTNEEYATAQEEYNNLMDEISIMRARQEGLLAELDRLETLTGELDQANSRRAATKSAFDTAVRRLAVHVNEGIPLTPPKYAHEERVQQVEALKEQVTSAKWVTPDLVDQYTSIFAKELAIASSREYFFAQVPVENKLGVTNLKWAECVMNGNWSVYFRTLDGEQIGIYQNVSAPDTPRYEFVQFLTKPVEKYVEDQVISNRTPDYQEKARVLAERQLKLEGDTPWQKAFSSL